MQLARYNFRASPFVAKKVVIQRLRVGKDMVESRKYWNVKLDRFTCLMSRSNLNRTGQVAQGDILLLTTAS